MNIKNLNNQAKKYFDNKNFDAALQTLLRIQNPPIELYSNIAKCYYYNRQADLALEYVNRIPNKDTSTQIDRALYLNALGRFAEAEKIYESLDQSDLRVRFNYGWHLLRNNDFQKGFHYIQSGAKCRAWGTEYIYLEKNILNSKKRWAGQKTNHLALILEGGLGDEMIFLRWANHLKTYCNKLTILCSDSLLRLLTNAGYDCEPIGLLKHIQYDYYCPAMSIPDILKLDSPTQHVEFPYIRSFAEPYIIKQMNKIAGNKPKIGIRFYGNKEFEHDQFRSPPRKDLESLSKYGQLFSLQLEEKDSCDIPNCNVLIKDWQDTYSVFSGLDILVTTCTSTAHLAGATGIKTFVLVPLVPYFVWASDDQFWYQKNVDIIRQTEYNNWTEPLKKLNNELSELYNNQPKNSGSCQ